MSKATESDLAALHGAVARGLTQAISEGVPVLVKKGEDTELEKAPAPAAYYAAAITLLKNNNITADAEANGDLAALTKALQEKRKANKGKLLDRQSLADAAASLERDLPGFMQ
jgi:hypothetical protein